MIRESRECVINLPTTALTDAVVGIGNTSGADIDKFAQFDLTAEQAREVDAPLIGECHANFECRLRDDALVEKYNFFIFRSEEHTSELQSLMRISYAVLCLKNTKN